MDSADKTEQLQDFTGFDTVSLFALIACVTVIVWSLVSHAINDQRLTEAQIEAERIAIQILAADQANPASDGLNRQPSSKETLINERGVDPWGRPYLYREYLDGEDKPIVAVYSRGPNGIIDTADSDFLVDQSGRFIRAKFTGDDIGTVQKSWR